MTDAASQPGSPLAPELDARLRRELGLAFLPTVFTLLAEHERYLAAAAEAFLSVHIGGVAEHGAETRDLAYTAASTMVEVPLRAGPDTSEIMALIHGYNQVNPPSLLFTLFLAPASGVSFRVMEPPLPDAGTGGDALLEDIRACHGEFNLPGFWRELATSWPRAAAQGWSLVRALPANPAFARAVRAVSRLATETLPGGVAPSPSDVGCSAAEAEQINRLASFYALVIPTMIVEIECLRRALVLAGSAVDE